MKHTDGAWLENLVALIEGQTLPIGFKVQTRKPVFNDVGHQIAEFDIVISGQLGTSEVSWLIECRDRPSDGAAPGEWIEQLIGRRDRFHFHKVMAVSSTGFSPGAIEAARDFGIDLRSMELLTHKEVSRWLPLNAPMIIRENHLNAVRILMASPRAGTRGSRWRCRSDEKIFVGRTSGNVVSLTEIWGNVVKNNDLWKDIPVGGPARTMTVRAEQYLPEKHSVLVDGETIAISSIEFDSTLRAVVPKMPLVKAADYSSESVGGSGKKRPFATLGCWRSADGGPIKELTVIAYPKDDGTDRET